MLQVKLNDYVYGIVNTCRCTFGCSQQFCGKPRQGAEQFSARS
jgi:hypothetical protein